MAFIGKTKKFLSLLLMMFTILLSSCNSSNNTGSNDNGSNNSDNSNSQPDDDGEDLNFDTIVFHFNGDGLALADWCLWIWEEGGDGAIFLFNEPNDDYGAIAQYPSNTWKTKTKLNFITRKKTTWAGQSPDNYIRYADFKDHINDQGELHVYLIHLEREIFATQAEAQGDRILKAYFVDWKTIKFETTSNFHSYELYKGETLLHSGANGQSGQLVNLTNDADLSENYMVHVLFKVDDKKVKLKSVAATNLFETPKFLSDYSYDGNDLGAIYTQEKTTFKLWAPTSSKVTLRIYIVGTPSTVSNNTLTDAMVGQYNMIRETGGVYSYTVTGDLHGRYYNYVVTNSEGTNEIIDPYAKSSGINGLRGQIIDFSRTNPEGWDQLSFTDISAPTDLTIYEMHVRDLSIDESWNGEQANRGKYLGLIEQGTTISKSGQTAATGFDHLLELGVNAIQLMPIYDQANNETLNTYNWGYNPLNYNVLEGQYSSMPYAGDIKVSEFKQVVQTWAEHDIRIMMDVVYNHVASATSSNFNMIVPGYYFRLNADGTYSDGAGVGNEVKTERKMMSKFIVDSLVFWASEYNIKGFRFDLMDLIDTQTLQNARTALNAIDPSIVIYGEPWSAVGYNPGRVYTNLNGIGGFNDQGRNGIRGGNGFDERWGWMQKGETHNKEDVSNINKVKGMLAGMNGNYYDYNNWDPKKTINYASCHDNMTLFDQLSQSVDSADIMKASVAVNALVTFGVGVPFINGGEEIMRSKIAAEDDLVDTYYVTDSGVKISHNSYRSPDGVNSYKWENKITYQEYFQLYKKMIALRKQYSLLCLSDKNVIGRKAEGYSQGKQMGFWDGDLSFSTIAAWYQNSDTILYLFANARESVKTGTLTSNVIWGNANDKVTVLFDSTNKYAEGTVLSGSVLLDSYQVLLVQRQ